MAKVNIGNFSIFKITLITIFGFSTTCTNAQQNKIDSLKHAISIEKEDSVKIFLFDYLGNEYRKARKMDSSILSYKQALEINEKINFSLQRLCWNTAAIDYILYEMGDYTESLKYAVKHLGLSERLNDTVHKGFSHLVFGHDYRQLGDYRQSLDHYFKAKKFFKAYHLGRGHREDDTYTILCIAQVYLSMNQLDSALIYTRYGYKLGKEDPAGGVYILLATRILGDIFLAKGDDETALAYFRQYIPDYVKYKETNRDLSFVLNNMARIFQKRNQKDSAIYYAKKALSNAQEYHDQQNIYYAATALYNFYDDKSDYKKMPNAKNRITVDNKVAGMKIDSLKNELQLAETDSAKLDIIRQIGQHYRDAAKLDSSIQIYQQALEFVQKSKLPVIYEIWQLATLDYLTSITGNYSMSMQYANRALLLSEQIKNNEQIAFALSNIAADYQGMGDFRKALDYYFKAKKAFETYESGHWAIQNIAETYLKMHMLDSALYYNHKAYHIADTGRDQQYMKDFAIRVFGNIYAEKGDDQLALKYYRQFVTDFYKYNLNNREIDRAYLGIAKLYHKNGKIDSSIFYAEKALNAAEIYNDQEHILNTSNFLYSLHDSLHNESLAFMYFRIAAAAKDSMASLEKMRQIQNLTFNEQIREKERQKADAKEAARNKLIIIIAAILISIISFLIWSRIKQLKVRHTMILDQKEGEKLKTKYEKELHELEAKALRAQMNPHFIFNCMNSIKALIQQEEKDKAVNYLTTFSKLIRTIFHNSDKREITLYDEIETCKLYAQLESMRFGNKFKYHFNVDETIDLKSVQVPALIIQPFIENAIWHGIMPKGNSGTVTISVHQKENYISCTIDDDGIGREVSKQNKFNGGAVTHQSKGMELTRSRLDLDNVLNKRRGSIETIDKIGTKGKSSGTKVILTFTED